MFELKRMSLIGPSDSREFGGKVFVYVPTSDSFTAVSTSGYFNDYLDSLTPEDSIIVHHSHGRNLLTVATNSGGVVTTNAGQQGLEQIQTLVGPGAIDIITDITFLIAQGTDAMTLVDGAYLGQLKDILVVLDGGTATITPDTPLGYTNITMPDKGDYVTLRWVLSGWAVKSQGGLGTGPVVA